MGANDHSQCRRGEICNHARVVTPEIDRDRYMVVHREFVLDYTTEMVNTIMEVERGTNGLTFRHVYGALNEFGQQMRESVTITGTYVVNGRNGATSVRAVDETFFYHHNRLGSSEFLTSDVNGRIVSFVEYDQWGRPTRISALTLGNREIDLVTRFTGHRYDPVLGMYYARFRMYDPNIRRFISTDPVRGTVLIPHTMVQYTYVLNNPIRFIDAWGLWTGPCGRTWCNEKDGWEDAGSTFVSPPTPPSFDSILEEVWDWIESMTDDELMFAISSGLFEAMGVYIPSDWLDGLGSDGHLDFNEIRQDMVHFVADAIWEDSSGLGMDLLSGWVYNHGNGWGNLPDSSSREVVINLPTPPSTNISWWQYTPSEFRRLAISRESIGVYLESMRVGAVLTESQRIFVATIASEAIGENTLSQQAVAHVIMNRVDDSTREWRHLNTVVDVISQPWAFTGFHLQEPQYILAINYLNNRTGDNQLYENLINLVLPIYNRTNTGMEDMTGGSLLFYSPRSMVPAGSTPNWNFGLLEEVIVPGIPSDSFRFFRYR